MSETKITEISLDPYKIKKDGVYKEVIKQEKDNTRIYDEKICLTPFNIIAKGDNVDTNAILFKLKVKDLKGRIKTTWKSASDLLTHSGILELMAKDGFAFKEAATPSIENLLEKYLDAVRNELPEEITASRSGWKNNYNLFVCGSTGYTADGKITVLQLENNTADMYTQKGSIESWKYGAQKLFQFDAVRFKAYASCTPLILALLGVQSFIVEQIVISGMLKTLSHEGCASMFGDPKQLLLNARSTPKGIEAFVGYNTDLPTFIDETSTNPDDIKEMIYTIANGIGRSTSNKSKGFEMPKTWNTVTLTTGENPILPANAKMGQLVRDIPLRDGVSQQLTPNEINDIEQSVRKNYGLIRDLLIEEIFRNKDDLYDIYSCYYDEFETPDTKSNTDARVKRFYAAIATAGFLLETVFGKIGIEQKDAFDIVNKYYTDNVICNNVFIPDHERAFKAFKDWFAGNRLYFEESEDGDLPDEEHKINHERYGWIRAGKIQITPTKLEQVITQLGYNYKGCIDNWKINEKYLDKRSHKKNGKDYYEYVFDLTDHGITQKVYRIPYNIESPELKTVDDRTEAPRRKGKMPVLHKK